MEEDVFHVKLVPGFWKDRMVVKVICSICGHIQTRFHIHTAAEAAANHLVLHLKSFLGNLTKEEEK